jgi:hypothetical protein
MECQLVHLEQMLVADLDSTFVQAAQHLFIMDLGLSGVFIN